MPDRAGAAVLDDLPDDIIVGKILILLPPKDIGRCRMVRTSWRSATSSPEFMVEHRRRQLSLPIMYGDGRPARFVTLRDAATAGATSQQLWPFLSRCRQSCCEIRLHASSDGFLIVSWGDRFYICNPTTRKHALLPFLRPPRPYTGVWPPYIDIYIHGLLGDHESRRIQAIMPTLSSPSLDQPSPSREHYANSIQ